MSSEAEVTLQWQKNQ